ncbi:hypothetical protein MN608_07727 [Microdochium nivale]|nr:hypothetical protein MN608_07727 [Microdochium nivale]
MGEDGMTDDETMAVTETADEYESQVDNESLPDNESIADYDFRTPMADRPGYRSETDDTTDSDSDSDGPMSNTSDSSTLRNNSMSAAFDQKPLDRIAQAQQIRDWARYQIQAKAMIKQKPGLADRNIHDVVRMAKNVHILLLQKRARQYKISRTKQRRMEKEENKAKKTEASARKIANDIRRRDFEVAYNCAKRNAHNAPMESAKPHQFKPMPLRSTKEWGQVLLSGTSENYFLPLGKGRARLGNLKTLLMAPIA